MPLRALLCLFILASPAFAAWTDFNLDCRGSGGRVETDRDGNRVCRCESGDTVSPPYATCPGVTNLNQLCFDSGGTVVEPTRGQAQCRCADGSMVVPGRTTCKRAKPTPTPTPTPSAGAWDAECFTNGMNAPDCVQIPWSRENHLGSGATPPPAAPK